MSRALVKDQKEKKHTRHVRNAARGNRVKKKNTQRARDTRLEPFVVLVKHKRTYLRHVRVGGGDGATRLGYVFDALP